MTSGEAWPWIKWGVVLLIGILVLGVGVLWATGFMRAGRDAIERLGQPTPEEARVKVERAITKENGKTEAEIDAIRKSDNDALVRRARELRERGRAGKPADDR